MRNPKRIPKMLARIKKIWDKNPDLRLMQLITNVTDHGPMTYYIEDDDLLASIEAFYD